MKENWELMHKGNDPHFFDDPFAPRNMFHRKKGLIATHEFMGFNPY